MFSRDAARAVVTVKLSELSAEIAVLRDKALIYKVPNEIVDFLQGELQEIQSLARKSLEERCSIVRAKSEESGHLLPRKQVFRRNYDYDEGWHAIMDDFRAGKIKGISDFLKKKKKESPRIKDLYEKEVKDKVTDFIEDPEQAYLDEFLEQMARSSAARKERQKPQLTYSRKMDEYWKLNRKQGSQQVEDFIDYSNLVDG